MMLLNFVRPYLNIAILISYKISTLIERGGVFKFIFPIQNNDLGTLSQIDEQK